MSNGSTLIEKCIQDELGANRMEIVRLRAAIAGLRDENTHQKAIIAGYEAKENEAKESAPALPLEVPNGSVKH